MKDGFSLIEVMVALLIIMLFSVSITKLYILSVRSNAYSEMNTRATILGHTKLVWLKSAKTASSEIKGPWHKDQDNPIMDKNLSFYRFWGIEDKVFGKEISMYVAWDDGNGGTLKDFSSAAELKGSKCASINLTDFITSQ